MAFDWPNSLIALGLYAAVLVIWEGWKAYKRHQKLPKDQV